VCSFTCSITLADTVYLAFGSSSNYTISVYSSNILIPPSLTIHDSIEPITVQGNFQLASYLCRLISADRAVAVLSTSVSRTVLQTQCGFTYPIKLGVFFLQLAVDNGNGYPIWEDAGQYWIRELSSHECLSNYELEHVVEFRLQSSTFKHDAIVSTSTSRRCSPGTMSDPLSIVPGNTTMFATELVVAFDEA
jgi:hypothetical protein